MDNRVQLTVLGLSYSQAQTGAYALILSNGNDDRRIPVVIGAAEAQSIAIIMEKMVTPRPLTHDLFSSFCEGFGVEVQEINIYRLDEGIFYSEIICKNAQQKVVIDARTSDAVAIALRTDSPIYTSQEIMEKAGISIVEKEIPEAAESKAPRPQDTPQDKPRESFTSRPEPENKYAGYTIAQLKSLIEEAISNENYERASELRDEITRREK